MSSDFYVALPHGAVGWSAVCDCGIFDHTHLLFSYSFTFFILIHSFKVQQKSGIGVIMQFLGNRI